MTVFELDGLVREKTDSRFRVVNAKEHSDIRYKLAALASDQSTMRADVMRMESAIQKVRDLAESYRVAGQYDVSDKIRACLK